MRSFLLLTCLLAVGTICVVATASNPAALEAPQVDDVTLLQMDATARTGSVAALETELAAAMQSQQALEAELRAQSTATIGAQSDVDSEQEAEVEADAESEAEAAAELEAELEAEAEGELDAESESESEVEEASAKHSMRFSEKKPKDEHKSHSKKHDEKKSHSHKHEKNSHHSEKSSSKKHSSEKHSSGKKHSSEKKHHSSGKKHSSEKKHHSSGQKHSSSKKHSSGKKHSSEKKKHSSEKKKHSHKKHSKKAQKAKEVKCPRGRKGFMCRRAKRALIKVTRSDPDKTPDIVEIPGKVPTKLYKSWVVHPNLVLTPPKAKVVPRHSRERAMTDFELQHYSRRAENKPTPAQRESEVRKAFLRLNPNAQVLPGQQLNVAFSPAAAFERLFRAGHFPQLRFDPPTHAGARRSSVNMANVPAGAQLFDQQGNELVVGKPSTTTHTSHHLTVRSHSPSVRQRAEVSALRSASRTLRRINFKRREYKRALRALRQARTQIQKQIHAHHVAKAIQARKVAAAAQRRAAWSALLQHRSLRKELLHSIQSVLEDGMLTGAARRRAIKQLIKLNVSPKQRAKLHAFIRGGARKSKRSKKAKKPKKSNKKVRAPKHGASSASSSAAAKKVAAPRPAAKKAAAPSAKDQTAVQALVARIRAAINTTPATATPASATPAAAATPAPVGLSPLAAAVGAVAKNGAASASTNAAKRATTPIRAKAAAPKVATPAPAAKNGASTASANASKHVLTRSVAPAASGVKNGASSQSTNASKRGVVHAAAPGPSAQSALAAKKRALPPRFAQLRSAEALAAEAEAEALQALNAETEIDDVKDAPLLQVQAQVEAAAHNTEELFHEYQL